MKITTTSAPLKSDPREQKQFYFYATPLRKAVVAVLRAALSCIMDMYIEGLEVFPLDGPIIVVSNHVTNFDVFPMQLALPRPIFYMGKAELFKNPITDVLFRNLGAFPVSRDKKDPWAYNQALKVLAHGQTLGMFPEGTRSKGRGLGVARTGVARMAIETDTQIVPMAVVGSDKLFKRFPRRARVTVNLLPPIFPKPNETPLGLTDRLMFTLAAALPAEMRGVYAEVPKGFGKQ
jgi:1-acyl-sn-glycerol-3-phosphate acyltransferase